MLRASGPIGIAGDYFLFAQSQGSAQRHVLWQLQVSPQVQRGAAAFAHSHAACAHPHSFCSCWFWFMMSLLFPCAPDCAL